MIKQELRNMLDESYDMNQHTDVRLNKYAAHMGQDWKDLKRYFLDNTDGNEIIYHKAVDRFLSSEGF